MSGAFRAGAVPSAGSVYAWRMWRSALLTLWICGCASAPASPYFGDERYLRFGVDPNQEANAVIESQKARHYPLALRLLGQNFTALGFMDGRGRSTAVRILTLRGIVVALDPRPQTPLQESLSYTLLEAPIEGTHDADGDSFEEVFVEQRTQSRRCLQVYRVRDVGFVDPVEQDAQVMGQPFCAEAAADLDGDGKVELVGELVIGGFEPAGLHASATAPRLHLPLWASEHRFAARSGTAAQRAWLTRERREREVELADARKHLDVPRSFTLAIELAALAHLGGGDPVVQLGAFDRALSGLVLTGPQAAAGMRARGQIYADWNAPRAAESDSKTAPTLDEAEAKQRNSGVAEPKLKPAAAAGATARGKPSDASAAPAARDAAHAAPATSEPAAASAAAPSAASPAPTSARGAAVSATAAAATATSPPPSAASTARAPARGAPVAASAAAANRAPSSMPANRPGASPSNTTRTGTAAGHTPRAASAAAAGSERESTQPAAPARSVAKSGDGDAASTDPLRQRLLDQLRSVESNAPVESRSAQHGFKPRRFGEAVESAGERPSQTAPPTAAEAQRPAPAAQAAGHEPSSARARSAAAEPSHGDVIIHPNATAASAPRGHASGRPNSTATRAQPPTTSAAGGRANERPSAPAPRPADGKPNAAAVPRDATSARPADPSRPAAVPPPAAATPSAALSAERARARELGNAAVATRRQSLAARREAEAARERAQEVRLRAASAANPEAATELRAEVAQRVAEVERHVAEADRLAAEAARLRAELTELKTRAAPADSPSPTPPAR
jgi:hypothetical protein